LNSSRLFEGSRSTNAACPSGRRSKRRKGSAKNSRPFFADPAEQPLPVRPLPEYDPEVSGVGLGSGLDVVAEVADDRVAEEVQGDAVSVAPGQRAAEALDVEPSGVLQIPGRDRQVEHVQVARITTPPARCRTADRRSLSIAITSSARTLPTLTQGPIRRRK
jgi:hypothetical protein